MEKVQKVFKKKAKKDDGGEEEGEVEEEEVEQLTEKLAKVGLTAEVTLADFERIRTLGKYCFVLLLNGVLIPPLLLHRYWNIWQSVPCEAHSYWQFFCTEGVAQDGGRTVEASGPH